MEADNVSQNLLSTVGFLKSMELTLRIAAFGLLYGGLPCKSYIFISSATHQRSATEPQGATHPFVLEGTTMLDRFTILGLIAIARGAVWLCENPGRTILDVMPSMLRLMNVRLKPLMVRWLLAFNQQPLSKKKVIVNTLLEGLKSKPHNRLTQSINRVFELRSMGMLGGPTPKPELGLGNASGSQLRCFQCMHM